MVKNLLSNPQILSAIIWATTIVASSSITENPQLINLLLVASGFHVVMMMKTKTLVNEQCK